MKNKLTYAPLAVAILAIFIAVFALVQAGNVTGDFEALGLHPGGTYIHPGGDTNIVGQLNVTDDIKVGDGSPDTTLNGEDGYIEGTFEVDGSINFDGAVDMASTLTVDGVTDLDDVDIDLSAEMEVDGHMVDFGGCTAGVADADNDVCIQGVLEVDTGITADGTLSVDGVTDLDDVDIDLSAEMEIDGHMVDIGGCTAGTADADNDLCVQGDLEVDTGIYGDGTLTVVGVTSLGDTLSVAGATTLATDVTITDNDGNAGAQNELQGLLKVTIASLSTLTDGSDTVAAIDASPTGEWAEVDGGTNITVTADTTYYRHTTNSLRAQITTVTDNEGVDGTITQSDFSGFESVGFWIYSDTSLTSGDFDVTLDDTDGTDQVYTVGAVTADTWTWIELDISGCDTNCNTTDGIHFLATTQGATNLTGIVNVYLDGMYVWDVADEETLGVNVIEDGVLAVLTITTDTAQSNTIDALAEYTDYIIHYQTGNDAIVILTDQSAESGIALVAYQ